MSELAAFDREWRAKLRKELGQYVDADARERILDGEEMLGPEASSESIYDWTWGMLARLEERLPAPAWKDVLNACGCWMGKEALRELRGLYAATGDLDLVLEKAGEGLWTLLRSRGVREKTIEEIRSRGWGWPGRRAGSVIRVTKIPFEDVIEAFFAEPDPAKRRTMNYCHCPRVREILRTGKGLSKTYCHCSAGFYKKNFEEILQRPVDVEIVQTVLSGDDVCSFAIHLPEGI
jgi:hypothetical protein